MLYPLSSLAAVQEGLVTYTYWKDGDSSLSPFAKAMESLTPQVEVEAPDLRLEEPFEEVQLHGQRHPHASIPCKELLDHRCKAKVLA